MNADSDHKPGLIVLSAGMGSAGSGWFYNLTNDLLVAAGQRDVHELRDEYGLSDILFTRNCANDLRRREDVQRLLKVAADGHTLVVKSHKPPSRMFRRLLREGRAKATYIHRDPRDVVMSVFERGTKGRARGRRKAFARFSSVWQVILWVRFRLLQVYDAWARCPDTLFVRYEDLRADPMREMNRLAAFLGVEVPQERMSEIVAAYEGEQARQRSGTHYRGGGTRRAGLTAAQHRVCNRLFGPHLARMGYER